ncbi:hypothetical protein T492DRAFT_895109 [Pavlovales sp. CCMP2436]|nr:hypothetical protein T492DRAFT_895109 [Pavlovales sp. CCMP2436]
MGEARLPYGRTTVKVAECVAERVAAARVAERDQAGGHLPGYTDLIRDFKTTSASRAARRFDILMSEGEESVDPDELPTRYAKFNERKLCVTGVLADDEVFGETGTHAELGTFEIETILKYRCNRMKRRNEWLVKWKNYPTSKNTWKQFSHFMTREFRDLANDLKLEQQ